MEPVRLHWKIYLREGPKPSHEALTRVFHEWVATSVLDELLIDVADYTHVHRGPGTLLVGHGADYSVSDGDGRWGLLYSRKREDGDRVARSMPARLGDGLARLLDVAQRLETEPRLDLSFRTDELLLRINDRLSTENTPAHFEALAPALRAVLGPVVGKEGHAVEHVGAPDELLTVRVRVDGALSLDTLAQRAREAARSAA